MSKSLFLITILFLMTAPVLAESVDTAWVRSYNGPGNNTDQAYSIAVDDSGSIYVTGESQAAGLNSDYATIKYLPTGDTAWVRRYNGPGNIDDAALDLAIDDSGNVYVTGMSPGMGTSVDYATIKYLPDGDTAWVRRYNGTANSGDVANGVDVDDFGNVYVTGYSVGSGTSLDYATIKYLPNGDTAWVRRYDGPAGSSDAAFAIVVDDSGNAYVSGQSTGSGTGYDYATIKYLPNGDTAWVRRYNGPGNSSDAAFAIVIDDSGNAYVSGQSTGNGTGSDYATIKYLPGGDTAWVRRYNGPGNSEDRPYGIVADSSGNVYVTGYSIGSGTGYDYATIKYLSNGDTAWVRRYDGPAGSSDAAFAIAVDSSGNAYVTGTSASSGTNSDCTTIKYLSGGDTAWVTRFNGTDDRGYGITVDGAGNIYVTGYSYDGVTNLNYLTIKYVQASNGVEDATSKKEIPCSFTLSQNFPNPFNASTKIEFTLKNSGFVNLNIYDILGRKVRALVSQDLSMGHKSVIWDGKDDSGNYVASGTYFCKIKTKEFSETKKLVLLK